MQHEHNYKSHMQSYNNAPLHRDTSGRQYIRQLQTQLVALSNFYFVKLLLNCHCKCCLMFIMENCLKSTFKVKGVRHTILLSFPSTSGFLPSRLSDYLFNLVLFISIYWQARTYSMPLFCIAIEKYLGGKLECLGEKLPPPSRLNPAWVQVRVCYIRAMAVDLRVE